MLAKLFQCLGDGQVMTLRVHDHALLGRESRQATQRRHMARTLTKNLVAERDGVVQESAQRVFVGAFLEQCNGLVGLTDAQVQVPDTIAEGDVDVVRPAMFGEQLLIQRERLLRLLFQLESGGLLFEHCRR